MLPRLNCLANQKKQLEYIKFSSQEMGSKDKGFLLKMDSFYMNVGGLGVCTQTQPTSLNASMYNKGMRREGYERENG